MSPRRRAAVPNRPRRRPSGGSAGPRPWVSRYTTRAPARIKKATTATAATPLRCCHQYSCYVVLTSIYNHFPHRGSAALHRLPDYRGSAALHRLPDYRGFAALHRLPDCCRPFGTFNFPLLTFNYIVRIGGLEPPPLAGQDPKSCAAANYAISALCLSACQKRVQRYTLFFECRRKIILKNTLFIGACSPVVP